MQFVLVGKLAENIKGDIGGKRFAKFPVTQKGMHSFMFDTS